MRTAMRATTDQSAPLVHAISRFIIPEGDRAVLVAPDGSRTTMDLARHEASVTVTRDEILSGNAVAKVIKAVGEQLGDEIDRSIVKGIQSLPPETAGTFGGRTAAELGENLLETVRRVDVSFDDDGEPNVAFVIHPDSRDQLMALESDPELKREFDSILERKKHEWIRRESNRRLVD